MQVVLKKNKKKYSVTNKISYGYSTTLTLLECNDIGDKIYTIAEKFAEGETKTFTSQKNTVKVKIYVKAESYFGDATGYVQQVYYLEEGTTKNIIIDDNTIIGNNEP